MGFLTKESEFRDPIDGLDASVIFGFSGQVPYGSGRCRSHAEVAHARAVQAESCLKLICRELREFGFPFRPEKIGKGAYASSECRIGQTSVVLFLAQIGEDQSNKELTYEFQIHASKINSRKQSFFTRNQSEFARAEDISLFKRLISETDSILVRLAVASSVKWISDNRYGPKHAENN